MKCMRRLATPALCLLIAACGDAYVPNSSQPGSPSPSPPSTPGISRPIGDSTLVPAERGGELGGDACNGLRGGESFRLPGAGTTYCMKAHPDCQVAGAMCPVYITLNTNGAYFERVDQPERYGKFITVESRQPMDGNDVKDPLAELPRVLARDLPGLDPDRLYLIGWSAGAGGVSRGTCHSSKGYDQSRFGTTSDLYAALTTLGGCPSCSDNFRPISGTWHVFATNGIDDIFGAQGCEDSLRRLATINGCSLAEQASWCAPGPSDPLLSVAPGDASVVEKISFGECPGGDVIGYRFHDEAHVVSYRAHFDPRVRAYDLVWDFLQGRTKKNAGPAHHSGGCP